MRVGFEGEALLVVVLDHVSKLLESDVGAGESPPCQLKGLNSCSCLLHRSLISNEGN